MDALLQKHGAKHIFKVPEGLRELCIDISREVLRSQPQEIYEFIADYANTLLMTRENTKVALKIVNNILLGSQTILSILYRSCLSLEQIAIAAPRIQATFHDYLNLVDAEPGKPCDDKTCDETCKLTICNILEEIGVMHKNAEYIATVIQAAFRSHYERICQDDAEGNEQWQRAVANTLDIFRKTGASETEISKASKLVQYAYRGYYTRRNKQTVMSDVDERGKAETVERVSEPLHPAETVQAVAWLQMICEDSELVAQKENAAATIIQRAYKRYRMRKGYYKVQRIKSTKTIAMEAITDSLQQKVVEVVISHSNIPEKCGSREKMNNAGIELQVALNETELTMTREAEKVELSPEQETVSLKSEMKSKLQSLGRVSSVGSSQLESKKASGNGQSQSDSEIE